MALISIAKFPSTVIMALMRYAAREAVKRSNADASCPELQRFAYDD
jgi:hypothetical protein